MVYDDGATEIHTTGARNRKTDSNRRREAEPEIVIRKKKKEREGRRWSKGIGAVNGQGKRDDK